MSVLVGDREPLIADQGEPYIQDPTAVVITTTKSSPGSIESMTWNDLVSAEAITRRSYCQPAAYAVSSRR